MQLQKLVFPIYFARIIFVPGCEKFPKSQNFSAVVYSSNIMEIVAGVETEKNPVKDRDAVYEDMRRFVVHLHN